MATPLRDPGHLSRYVVEWIVAYQKSRLARLQIAAADDLALG